jgi:hypothetical protein
MPFACRISLLSLIVKSDPLSAEHRQGAARFQVIKGSIRTQSIEKLRFHREDVAFAALAHHCFHNTVIGPSTARPYASRLVEIERSLTPARIVTSFFETACLVQQPLWTLAHEWQLSGPDVSFWPIAPNRGDRNSLVAVGYSGYREAQEPAGSVAIDAVDGAHSAASEWHRVVALKRTTMRGAVHGRS